MKKIYVLMMVYLLFSGMACAVDVVVNAPYAGSVLAQDGVDGSAVQGNSMTIVLGGMVGMVDGGDAIGSRQTGSGEVYNNKVVMTGGAVRKIGGTGGNIIGGLAHTSDAYRNTVSISGGTVDGGVTGGVSNGGVAYSNKVEINGGTIGDMNSEITGGMSHNNTARDNEVYIVLGGDTYLGSVVGGTSGSANTDHSAKANTVTVTSGIIQGGVIGGRADDAASAIGNQVTIRGGEIRTAIGGMTDTGNATGNTVTFDGGTINGGGGIYGGYTDTGTATNNTVIIKSGSLDFCDVYGGLSTSASGDLRTGNTLHFDGFTGQVNEIGNFEFIKFTIPASVLNGGTVVTSASRTDLTDTKVQSIAIASGSSLAASHTVTLIDNVQGAFSETTIQTTNGASLILNTRVALEGTALKAYFGESRASVNPQGKALSMGRVGGMHLIGQGGDLVADQAFGSAADAVAAAGAGGGVPAFFGAFSISDYRIKTGSHVDADGWSVMGGLAWRGTGPDCSGWLAGAFFETGRGSYDGYNAFSTGTVHSWGDNEYLGGGVMGRYRLQNGLRVEGSFRIGRTKTDVTMRGYATPDQPDYDLKTLYLGSHIGLGYDRDLTQCLNLDLSAKYLWTHQRGKTVTILDEHTRFDATNSHRLRAGGRVTYTGSRVRPYAGAYFEYEFDGKAETENLASNIRYDSPKTRGATYIGELGLKYSPIERLDIDLSVQGHAGRRDGVNGSLKVGLSF